MLVGFLRIYARCVAAYVGRAAEAGTQRLLRASPLPTISGGNDEVPAPHPDAERHPFRRAWLPRVRTGSNVRPGAGLSRAALSDAPLRTKEPAKRRLLEIPVCRKTTQEAPNTFHAIPTDGRRYTRLYSSRTKQRHLVSNTSNVPPTTGDCCSANATPPTNLILS
jgi:hypothetical protein